MKRRVLIGRIAQEAKEQGVGWKLLREGGNHTVYKLGAEMIPIPRHTEINEHTAQGIFKECETELGKGWWR